TEGRTVMESPARMSATEGRTVMESPARMSATEGRTVMESPARMSNVVIPAKAGIQANPANDEDQPAVYIMASARNGTLYVGVTSDLRQRIWQHRNDVIEGFTKKYGVHLLVYYELHHEMRSAIFREKQIKKW